MPAPKNPFKRHRFPKDIILQAVRWYCRFALAYRVVKDLLEERGVHVDAATFHRWVRKFGPEIAKRSFKHKSCRSLTWHVPSRQITAQSPAGRWMKPNCGLVGSGVAFGAPSISMAGRSIFA